MSDLELNPQASESIFRTLGGIHVEWNTARGMKRHSNMACSSAGTNFSTLSVRSIGVVALEYTDLGESRSSSMSCSSDSPYEESEYFPTT